MSVFSEILSEEEVKIVQNYVTNTNGNVFALRNLPEVIKGALFSRYSRSTLGLRSLLLKEFILNDESSFKSMVGESNDLLSVKKASEFYERILDGYGDDSISELGGAHIALENISMIAAKYVEDRRIGGSPLEKSTRYIYFDQKVNGEFRFYKEPILMTSAYRDIYLETCNLLFDTYNRLIPPLTKLIEEKLPKDHSVSKTAYTAALRAKVLDCIRSLLPASTLTNVGVFGNGRFFDGVVQKLFCHNLTEMQDLGRDLFAELSKVMPSFVKRVDPSSKYQRSYEIFIEQMTHDLKLIARTHGANFKRKKGASVELISYDPDAVNKVAATLLFEHTQTGLKELEEYCKGLPEEDVSRILDAAALSRENRRHKSPRALERAFFTFEVVSDFGIYRDLQRHRLLTQERQLLSCDLGYYIPQEILGTEMEKEYVHAMDRAKEAYDTIFKELPEEAQYVVPMAYNVHWYMHINLRELQWLTELRSSPAGHPNYRHVAQDMAKKLILVFPQFERFFKFVDFDGYDLGRLKQEIYRESKCSP